MTPEFDSRYLAARMRYIAGQYRHLNDMQQNAVLATEGPLLLLAGAGSGKTTVLINRISNLIRFGCASESELIADIVTEDDVVFLENLPEQITDAQRLRADFLCAVQPVSPWNILAITFTNKAAGELKERLCAMLGPQGADVWAMTFHAVCCRILRRYAEYIGYGPHFTIYDTTDSERVMKDIIRQLGLDEKTFPAKYVLTIISRQKDMLISPEEYADSAELSGDFRARHIAKAYSLYQSALQSNNAVDFDDIIVLTVKLLQEHEDVRTYYQRKFRYVLVDEYQDTNHAQYLLTSLLAGGYENICVVGDDDQSIYRFRGATIDNILNFEKQYRGARVIRLEQNYRSTQMILNAANAVISHNIGRKGKTLWTGNGTGDPITVYEASDERAEANYVVGQIVAAAKNGGFRDHAILYRTNAQSNAMEYALKINAIPYRIIGGTHFFDRAEVKDMLAYLCVINNRADNLRLKRIINNPPRGLGAKALETVERLAAASDLPLYGIVSDPYSYAPLERSAAKLLQFSRMIEGLAQLLEEGMALPDFYEEVMARTGYADALKAKETEESKSRLENVRELKSSILSYVENSEDPSLAGFLEEIALYTDIQEYNDSDDAVVLMTMHSAKGLEFPNVYLVGFEEGLFPGMRAIGEREEMEEERRLCYVAITRAKKKLTISHARQRMLYGRTTAAMPSRFLKEIPEDILVKKGGYQSRGYESGSSAFGYSRASSFSPPPKREYVHSAPVSRSAEAMPELNRGDMVEHSAFGQGLVLSVLKMGGNALLEIAFDRVGTKKLMAKSAMSYMKKL